VKPSGGSDDPRRFRPIRYKIKNQRLTIFSNAYITSKSQQDYLRESIKYGEENACSPGDAAERR
jgi:hypothetical protein